MGYIRLDYLGKVRTVKVRIGNVPYHRCTRVENPGEGLPDIFAKFPNGSRLSEKIVRGVLYFGFYCIFIKSFLKICLGRCCFPQPP
jgi:hypothetical protein